MRLLGSRLNCSWGRLFCSWGRLSWLRRIFWLLRRIFCSSCIGRYFWSWDDWGWVGLFKFDDLGGVCRLWGYKASCLHLCFAASEPNFVTRLDYGWAVYWCGSFGTFARHDNHASLFGLLNVFGRSFEPYFLPGLLHPM